jgi:hypothetical protein
MVCVQALWRGFAARKHYAEMRRQQGALVIQSNWRCSVKRGEFVALRQAAAVLQGAWRFVGIVKCPVWLCCHKARCPVLVLL